MTVRRPYVAIVTCGCRPTRVVACHSLLWRDAGMAGKAQRPRVLGHGGELLRTGTSFPFMGGRPHGQDRVEFLSYLFARPRPTGLGSNSTAQVILDAFRPVPCSKKLANANLRKVFDRLERVHGFTLTRADESSIKDANAAFCAGGPDIRWDSSGDSWIPSYAELMVETDPRGHPGEGSLTFRVGSVGFQQRPGAGI
jgi:hypothetical protein